MYLDTFALEYLVYLYLRYICGYVSVSVS